MALNSPYYKQPQMPGGGGGGGGNNQDLALVFYTQKLKKTATAAFAYLTKHERWSCPSYVTTATHPRVNSGSSIFFCLRGREVLGVKNHSAPAVLSSTDTTLPPHRRAASSPTHAVVNLHTKNPQKKQAPAVRLDHTPPQTDRSRASSRHPIPH